MKKIKLGNTDLYVTPVGFGALTVGPWQLNLSVAEGATLLRCALEQGINFVDTAEYYQTYPVIREALKTFEGTKVEGSANGEDGLVICSKSLAYSYADMKRAIDDCLCETDRECIEIFMLHEIRSEEDFKDRVGAWQALRDAKVSGQVKYIGISTHNVDVAQAVAGMSITNENGDVLDRPLSDMRFADVLFPLINFKSLGIRHFDGHGTKENMAKAIEVASNAGKGVFAMKVFGGGNLTSDYHAAINYVRNLPGIASIMMGFGAMDEVSHAIEIMENRIDPSYKPNVENKKVRIDQGDCMGCGECIKRCPNKAISYNKEGLAEINQQLCLTCGYCTPACKYMGIIRF